MEEKGKIYNVTPEQFEKFERDCLFWLKSLGMGDWQVTIVYDGTSDDTQYLAEVTSGILSRTAIIRLCKTTVHPPEEMNKKIPVTALHEVLEILLTDLAEVVKWNMVDRERNDFIEREKHAIIHRLVPALVAIESLKLSE